MNSTKSERAASARKSLIFLLFLGIVFFSGFPKWINVQVRKLTLDQPNFGVNPLKGAEVNVFESDWFLEDINGDPVDFIRFKSKPMVVNFWATWCLPCLAEMESLQNLSAELGDDIPVLFITNDKRDDVREYATKHGLTHLVFYSKGIPNALSHPAIPATFVISAAGRIEFFHMGSADWDDDEVVEKIRSISGVQP